MVNGVFHTRSAEATFELAYEIGEGLQTGAVILLEGDLGAGKTVFAKGIAAGLDIDPRTVSSPTFTIVNEHAGRLKLYHLDLYRLEGRLDELSSLGLDDLLNEPDSIAVIEWPERLGRYLIPGAFLVRITDRGGDAREIEIGIAKVQPADRGGPEDI